MKGGFSNKIIGLQNVILWEYVCLWCVLMFTLNKETNSFTFAYGWWFEGDIYASANVVGLWNKNTTDGTLGLFDSDNTHYQYGSNITFVFGSKEISYHQLVSKIFRIIQSKSNGLKSYCQTQMFLLQSVVSVMSVIPKLLIGLISPAWPSLTEPGLQSL